MKEKLTYVTGISHIGVAVENIERAAAQYELLGFTPSYEGTLRDETRGVQIKMMKNGGYTIELVAPLTAGAASPVDAYIQPKCYMCTMYVIRCRIWMRRWRCSGKTNSSRWMSLVLRMS